MRGHGSRDLIAFLAGTGLGAAAMRAWSVRAGGAAGGGLEGPEAVSASMERMHSLLGEIRGLMAHRPAPLSRPPARPPAPGEAGPERPVPRAAPSRHDAWRTPDHLGYGIPEKTFHERYVLAGLSALSALAGVAAARAALKAAGKAEALPAAPAAAGALLAAAWLAWRKGGNRPGGAVPRPPAAAPDGRRRDRTASP